MLPIKNIVPKGTIHTIKFHGYPPRDGKYIIILCPNGREHRAHVNGPFIQLAGQRGPIYMDDMLGPNDQWIKV